MSPNGGRSALTALILICAPTEVGGGFSLSAAPQFWQKYAPVCTAAWHDGHIKISWLSIIHHTSYHVIDLDGPLCECTPASFAATGSGWLPSSTSPPSTGSTCAPPT